MGRKKIRLIETFAGYGSQALALKRLNEDFEHHKISEWNIGANTSYNALHTEDKTDYTEGLEDTEVYNQLSNMHLTQDDKTVLEVDFYKRKGAEWSRRVYNEIKSNNNLGNILNITAKDLGVKDVDKFLYILTYSFPCTDLSTAGKQQGMKKGEGTRSGLLWEIERVLQESVEKGYNLPQVLFMENVKQVVSKKNKPDFDAWCLFLESLGYKNSYAILNSSEYGGTPQNRDRCYMVSILDGYEFEFPDKIETTTYLRDYLDKDVTNDRLYIRNEFAEKAMKENEGIDFVKIKDRYEKIKILGNYMKSNYESSRIVDINGYCPTVKDNHNTVTAIIDKTGRVRKLTVSEFGRLMGLTEEEVSAILSVQSDSKARKQFGNSIVVGVMVNIFGKLLKEIN